MMELATETASDTVQVTHHYKATREQVFKAWIDPVAIGRWFGPHSHTCKVEKFDVREGGEYQLRLIPTGEGEEPECGGDSTEDSVCAGSFVTVQAPERLAMTFGWIENGADVSDTLLTIQLFESGNGTDLVLTHERLPTRELREAHAGGWQGSLECLEEYLQGTA